MEVKKIHSVDDSATTLTMEKMIFKAEPYEHAFHSDHHAIRTSWLCPVLLETSLPIQGRWRISGEELSREGIPIAAEGVGGKGGRRLILHTHDGNVWVRKL